MSEPNDITPLHVELPTRKYRELKDNAKAGHRSLKGEILRLMEVVYGNDADAEAQRDEQPTAKETAAV